MTKYWQTKSMKIDKTWVKCEKILTKEKFWISMTVPVKEGYEQIVYHCDVKTNK